MPRLHSFLIGFLCLAAAASEASDVYEWRDAQGVEHLADTPPPSEQGVELLRVNGKDVNVFHAEPAPDTGATGTPNSTDQGNRMRIPRTETDCAEIHGRSCNWDDHWRGYAERSCARIGDGRCHSDAHLRAHYDPRVQARHAARRAAGHAHHR